MSDDYNLCVHLQSLFGDKIPQSALQEYIGRLNNMDDDKYLQYCNLIRYAVSAHLQGLVIDHDNDGTLSPIKFGKFQIIDDESRLRAGQGSVRQTIVQETDDLLLNTVFSLPSGPEKDKYLAGLMKLKTGRSIPGPSRTDSDGIYHSISDEPKQDLELVHAVQQEIHPFMDRFLRSREYLNDIPRHYNTLSGVYANAAKKSFVQLDGRIDTIDRYLRLRRNQITVFNTNRFLRDPRIYKLLNSDPNSVISSVYTGVEVTNGKFHIGEPLSNESIIGYIAVINEPGKKLRVVANTNLLLNCASSPLGSFLKSCNSSWAVQGVDSHEGTVNFLSRKLKEYSGSRNFHSVDMKNFTDRLPYESLQKLILNEFAERRLIRSSDVQVMDIICHGKYSFEQTTVCYGAGTPQGTEPSFPLCSFANGMVAAIAFKQSHNKPWEAINLNKLPFRVIGDDIVIWDDPTAERYKTLMTGLGVEISTDKCMTSPFYAEMCSKLISPDGIYQQKKILRREDKIDPPLQTIMSRMEYYSKFDDMSVLQRYIENSQVSPDVVNVINNVPKPYGLGDELSNILGKVVREEPVTKIELGTLLSHVSSIMKSEYGMSKGDIEHLFDVQSLYPEMEYSVIPDDFDSNQSNPANTLLDSLANDFANLTDKVFNSYQQDAFPDTSRERAASLLKFVNSISARLGESLLEIKKEHPQKLTSSGKSNVHILDRTLKQLGKQSPDELNVKDTGRSR